MCKCAVVRFYLSRRQCAMVTTKTSYGITNGNWPIKKKRDSLKSLDIYKRVCVHILLFFVSLALGCGVVVVGFSHLSFITMHNATFSQFSDFHRRTKGEKKTNEPRSYT